MSSEKKTLPGKRNVSPGIGDLSVSQLQYIAEQAIDYYLVLDEEDRIVHCSHVEEGFSWSEIENQPVYHFVEPQYHDLMREKYAEVRRTGEFASYEVVADLRGKGICNLLVRVGPLISAAMAGAICGSVFGMGLSAKR